jgi:hypothetical protein
MAFNRRFSPHFPQIPFAIERALIEMQGRGRSSRVIRAARSLRGRGLLAPPSQPQRLSQGGKLAIQAVTNRNETRETGNLRHLTAFLGGMESGGCASPRGHPRGDFPTVVMTEQLWARMGPLSCIISRWLLWSCAC